MAYEKGIAMKATTDDRTTGQDHDAARQRKVLVVDDEPQFVELVEAILQDRGFKVLHAYDGEQALQVAYRERPDVVVLDVMMPEQDGWLVCAKLKLVEPSPRILIATALLAEESDRFAGFVHADEILHKPFSGDELLSKVTRLANEPSSNGVRID